MTINQRSRRAGANALLGAFLVLVSCATLVAKWPGGGSPLLPPQGDVFGKSFEEWHVLYVTRYLQGTLEDQPTVGKVRLLPASSVDPVIVGETYVYVQDFDIALQPGTPLVAPPFWIWGERYAPELGLPDDTPQDVIDLAIFDSLEIRYILDGRVLLDGTGTELSDRMFGPTYFEEPIFYDGPTDYGSIAALFTQGIGAILHPLPVGAHTLQLIAHSDFFNSEYRITYHITVSPGQ